MIALSPGRGRPRILVIRRDNIGDLVCTTPLIAALRRQLPGAYLAALVTRYNAAVLDAHPDLDAVFAYTKAKHRAAGESLAAVYARRMQLVLRLRRLDFDWVLLPGGAHASAMRLARLVGARRLAVRRDDAPGHEAECCASLLPELGLAAEVPPPRIVADAARLAAVRARLAAALGQPPGQLIGLHISARKPPQRWPTARFAELARRLAARHPAAAFLLLWAPGAEDDPLHPGDDGKAAALAAELSDLPLLALPTTALAGLIAALASVDALVCADGGAMHLAAGLGKPIVCLFGNSDPARWRPWGVRHEVLQPPSRNVAEVSAAQVEAAWVRLAAL